MPGLESDGRSTRVARSPWSWFVALLALGIAVRGLLFWHYGLHTYPDSGTYLTAAHDLFSGGSWAGEGRRTPGYPLLIALVDASPSGLYLLNLAAGLVASSALFALAFVTTGRPGLAFLLGAFHDFNLQQLFLEGAMLSEAVSTATVAGVVALSAAAISELRAGRSCWGNLVALGALTGYSILVRPQFIFFIGLLPPMLIYAVSGLRRPTRMAIGSAVTVAIPALVLVLGWCGIVQQKMGPFALSTQAGFGLMNHTVDYIEWAPPRYAEIKEILLRTREARIAETGQSGNTVWIAWPQIQRATGWSLPTASREFQQLSAELFLQHPTFYLSSVAEAWIPFWSVPIIWDIDAFPSPMVRNALQALWSIEHPLLRLANLAFLLTVAAAAWPAVRRRLGWDSAMTLMAATVLASSLIQAMADKGAGSRYHMTTQSLVVLFVLVAAFRWHTTRTPTLAGGDRT